MKTKMRDKETTNAEFNRVMSIDAFVSDYEFMQQLYQINRVTEDSKKVMKRK